MKNTVSEESVPNLHDAELYALRHDARTGQLQCMFRTEDGRDVVLLLSGVTKFRCTDFGPQNVVLQLVIADSIQQIAPEDLRSYVTWLSGTSDGEQLAQPQEIELAMNEVLQGRLRCVFLNPHGVPSSERSPRKLSGS